ncbi:MAG: diacylglycerol/lipid kinase family protein, partial [Gaiella sp.]
PFASGVDDELVAAVEAALPGPLETVRTARQGDATELARAHDGVVDVVYVLSGDGTYNEVLNGLTGSGSAVAFLPGGGTSVLPRALGLPRDPVAAATRLRIERTRRISVGRANGRRFGFSAGVGIDAELVRRVDSRGRAADGRRPGDRAFVAEALRMVAARRGSLPPVLELAGIGPAAFALVANCDPYTYAGPLGLRLAAHASFDGGLDVVAPERLSPFRLPLLAWWALGRGRGHVRVHDADRVEIRCASPLPMQLDGEDVGDVEHVVLEAERAAVTVLV